MRAPLLASLAGAAAAALLLPAPAPAAEPPRFQLVWMREGAAAGCPSPAQAREQVRGWLGRDPFGDDAGQVIEATVREQGGRFRATVRVRDDQGRPRGSRSFDDAGPGCAAIARAALLAVVLTIDPDAPPAPPPAPSGPPPSGPRPASSAPASSAPASSAPASAAPASAAPARSSAPPSAPAAASSPDALVAAALDRVLAPGPSEPARAGAAGPAAGWRGELAAGGGAASGWLPGAGAMATLRGAVGVLDWLAVEAGARWLPLRRSGDRVASFGLTAAQLGACAAPLQDATGAVEACAGLGLGAMTAVVHQLEPLEPGSTLWAAAVVGARGRLELPGALFARLGAELMLPLRRLDYRVASEPSRAVFSTPAVGGSLGLELGVHFR